MQNMMLICSIYQFGLSSFCCLYATKIYVRINKMQPLAVTWKIFLPVVYRIMYSFVATLFFFSMEFCRKLLTVKCRILTSERLLIALEIFVKIYRISMNSKECNNCLLSFSNPCFSLRSQQYFFWRSVYLILVTESYHKVLK